MSAYELSGKKYPALVKQAEVLGMKMSEAWINVRCLGNVMPQALSIMDRVTRYRSENLISITVSLSSRLYVFRTL